MIKDGKNGKKTICNMWFMYLELTRYQLDPERRENDLKIYVHTFFVMP